MTEIILKAGREKSILKRHPWIFSGAISTVIGSPTPGQTVDVVSSMGGLLARAAYNPNSNIAGRIWTWDLNEIIDYQYFETRIQQAIDLRNKLGLERPSNALRLVHAESDGLPGLILDRYDDTCVVQLLTAGAEYWREDILRAIVACTGVSQIYERSDVDVRQLEGLPFSTGLLHGKNLINPIVITEDDIRYLVDVVNGHKTGFYLDQHDNRQLARNISTNRRVLDCFSYTGGFTLNCLLGSALKVTMVETSEQATDLAYKNLALNQLDLSKVELFKEDVFKFLRILRDKNEKYDLIILDPPKFAPTASQAERAARGYKDINLLALKLLNKNGYLLTFSCSGGVSEELFEKIVAGAALDAEVEAVILKRLFQSADHPVALNFPEGAYLKGFLIQRIS